ncbi:TetR/AcrR family transcriptional regulator [Celeribacter indicus]|uniref:TetR family transcriptional regulator n=1 Tax=Celeribacter indicus TaxID=1208324 RepID=A0A0B5DVW7_9RHOB|nr:TetR/AcrR family transcriptional regulator [Celeribacter indicus]AJE44901.1 TetR family transcriptional regulator [Celeribacter indicus]SDW97674.1 transcriptional regulator, TetR family [Celeribacter indicus]
MSDQGADGKRDQNTRATQIGDAAIEVLAAHGSRGLTHRAVDRHLDWPEGTTSRYFRTRDALMTAVVQRLIDVEVAHISSWQKQATVGEAMSRTRIVEVLAKAFRDWIAGDTRQIARYELSLEGLRRPAVHEAILTGRRKLNGIVEQALRAADFPNPPMQATLIVSGLDGLCHDHLLHPEIAVDPDEVEGILLRWLDAEHGAPESASAPDT